MRQLVIASLFLISAGGISQSTERPSFLNSKVLLDSLEKLHQSGDFNGMVLLGEINLKQQLEVEPKASLYYYLAVGLQVSDAEKGLLYLDSAQALSPQPSLYLKMQLQRVVLERKQANYQRALKIGKELLITGANDVDIIFSTHRNLSVVYRKLNQYDSAIQHIQEADSIAEQQGDLKKLYYAKLGWSNILYSLKRYEECLEIERQLLILSKKLDNKNLILTSLINLGASFANLNQPDSTITHYSNALKIATQIGDDHQKAIVMTNLSNTYARQGNYPQAIVAFREALAFSKSIQRLDIAVACQTLLSQLLYETGDYDFAVSTANEGVLLSIELQDIYHLMSLREVLAEGYAKLSNYKMANENLKQIQLLRDSILNKEKLEVISDLEFKYETVKKNSQIKKLENEALVSELELKQKNMYLIVGGIMFLLFVGLGYLFYRQRSLQNQLRLDNLNQRLLRSQLNPHFLYNALNAINQLMMTTDDKAKTSAFLTRFSRLTRLILENSMQESVALEEEVEFIENYLELQTLRFGTPFTYSVEVDEKIDLTMLSIPPMLTQPFVENAIEHGIMNKKEQGIIDIHFTLENNYLCMKVSDNGIGRDKAEALKKEEHKSVAIELTSERIKLIEKQQKKQVVLSIEDIIGDSSSVSGTCVTIKIPL